MSRTVRESDAVNPPARWRAVRAVAALGMLAVTALAQLPRDLVEEALDDPIDQFEVQAPLDQALDKLGEKTGLRFTIDPKVGELLPHGPRIEVTISIRKFSAREGLTRVFDRLGLRFEVRGDKLVILPAPVLERIGRRARVSEITLIQKLADARGDALLADGELPLDFLIDPATEPKKTLERALRQVQGDSALARLDRATQALKWAWRPDDQRIVLQTLRDDIARRLGWRLDLSYQRVPLDEVLVDLGRRIGVTMLFDSGALRAVEARDRAVDLVQRGESVRQTLERICGNTGLRYEITDDGVRILGPAGQLGDVAPAPGAAPAVGAQVVRMIVEVRPGVFMEVSLPADELPIELRADFEKKLKDLLNRTARK